MTVRLIFLTVIIAQTSLFQSCFGQHKKHKQNLTRETLIWQNKERDYLLHLPPKDKLDQKLPVLFNLHGGGGNAKGMARLTHRRFNELADEHGFIVVYPNALNKSWNDGRTIIQPNGEEIDDVGFITKIVDVLSNEYNVDMDRIFTSGISNGGFMSTRLLCDKAELFKGGAIVTATISSEYLPQCDPEKPVAVLVMNGTDDNLVPYDGGEIVVLGKSRGHIISTDAYISFWKERNGCTDPPESTYLEDEKLYDGTRVSISTFKDCNSQAKVKLYTIHGGGHTWPGGRQYLGKRLVGNTSREIIACDEIWDFFSSL